MSTYLETHPPARSQSRAPRRATPSGAIVVHTAESYGAENVARFISTRTDAPGSYHVVRGFDGRVQVMPYEWEAFGEGTGGNRWALHLSFAIKAADWPSMVPDRRTSLITGGAADAAHMAAWVHDTTGIVVPARHITRTQYHNGEPGFIGHGELDPGRRTDPGPGFPWTRFLTTYATAADVAPPTTGEPMPTAYEKRVGDATETLQRTLLAFDADLGTSGPNGDGIDRDPGPATLTAATSVIKMLEKSIEGHRRDAAMFREQISELEQDLDAARDAAGEPNEPDGLIIDQARRYEHLAAAIREMIQ